jgi:hypothetical protein
MGLAWQEDMALVVQFTNTLVIAVVGVLVWFYMRGRFDQGERLTDELKETMKRRFDEMRQDADRRFGEMRQDADRRFGEMRHEMNRRFDQNDRQHERFATDSAAARSDITQIALILGARPRPEANQV